MAETAQKWLCQQCVLLFTGGLDADLRRRHGETLAAGNYRLVRLLTPLGTLAGCVLTAVSFLTADQALARLLYVFFTLAISSLFIACCDKPTATPRRTTLLMYAILFLGYLFGALLGGAAQVDSSTVLYCVFLVVLPSLFVDQPWRVALPGLASWVLFLLLSFRNCSPQIFRLNLTNTTLSLIVGMFLSANTVRSKVRELHLRDALRSQRDTDALTGLTTRRAAEDSIRGMLDFGDSPGVMFLMDVDEFKRMNDTYGHSYGDKILADVGKLLKEHFRTSDVVCRLGGDEFLVFAPGISDPAWACGRADDLRADLAVRPTPDNKPLRASLSIGITLTPQQGLDFDTLYHKADHALYQSKKNGRNTYTLFGDTTAGPAAPQA